MSELNGSKRLNEDICYAMAVFRQAKDASDDLILRMLMSRGIAYKRAVRLLLFLPMAYCRVWLADSGAQFSSTFQRLLPDGALSPEMPLSSEGVWNEVVGYAQFEAKNGFFREDIVAVAWRSTEFKAINKALLDGAELSDLECSTPLLTFDEDCGEADENRNWDAKGSP